MKNFIYVLANIVFFNISVWLLHYLGVVNSNNSQAFDSMLEILIVNGVMIFIFFIYLFIYTRFLIDKFNYWRIALIGALVGVIVATLIPKENVQEKLFLILFTSFSFTFLSYCVYFDKIKQKVFH